MDYSQRNRSGGGDFGDRSRNSAGGDVGNVQKALLGKETIDFWTKGNRRELRKEVLDEEAQATAERLKTVKASQLRRHFAPVVALRQKILNGQSAGNPISDIEVQAQVAGLKAVAAYTVARENNPAKREAIMELVHIFVRASNSVKDREDLSAFIRHFEAVVAYHKVVAPKE
jgi:CRISPR type III-A-associated protein Csm2